MRSLSEWKRLVRSARERAHSRAVDEVDRSFAEGGAEETAGPADLYAREFARFYRMERQTLTLNFDQTDESPA